MKWIKMELKTTTEAVDLVSSMLDDLGVEGIEISDYVPLSEEEVAAIIKDEPQVSRRCLSIFCRSFRKMMEVQR